MTQHRVRRGSPFWDRVDKTGPCWEWIGARTSAGYGEMRGRGYAHRLAWEEANGPIPAGLCVLHKCDNPPCVRPDHLFLGTNLDNIRDMVAKGRSRRGERNVNAKLTGADIPVIREMAAAGLGTTAIGREFGVSDTAIRHILAGRTWTYIREEAQRTLGLNVA